MGLNVILNIDSDTNYYNSDLSLTRQFAHFLQLNHEFGVGIEFAKVSDLSQIDLEPLFKMTLGDEIDEDALAWTLENAESDQERARIKNKWQEGLEDSWQKCEEVQSRVQELVSWIKQHPEFRDSIVAVSESHRSEWISRYLDIESDENLIKDLNTLLKTIDDVMDKYGNKTKINFHFC